MHSAPCGHSVVLRRVARAWNTRCTMSQAQSSDHWRFNGMTTCHPRSSPTSLKPHATLPEDVSGPSPGRAPVFSIRQALGGRAKPWNWSSWYFPQELESGVARCRSHTVSYRESPSQPRMWTPRRKRERYALRGELNDVLAVLG